MDRIQELFDHIKTMESPEQVTEFVKTLPREDQVLLAMKAVEAVGNVAKHLVDHSEEIWATKEINCPELCTHQPGRFLHQGFGRIEYYECVKCGESFPRKYYS